MMRGKPVIGPNYGAPTEFIRHGEHGLLVNPEDPEAVAAALVELLDSPQRARRMGEAAREWVIGEYSYLRFVERLGALLHE
jgi:glycosyltransferase involved in cell wall biosynthesis